MNFMRFVRHKLLTVRKLAASFLIISVLVFLYSSFRNLVLQDPVSFNANIIVAPVQAQTKLGLPMRLKIPGLQVDALIEYVRLTPKGTMDTTKGPDTVAWYEPGKRPGESGSAVIAGHYGWKDGLPAVFDKLSSLHVGDKVYSEDEKGVATGFVVRELRQYGQNDDTTDVFSSSDGKAHLNLITCEGDWNASTNSYTGRLVVFADKE